MWTLTLHRGKSLSFNLDRILKCRKALFKELKTERKTGPLKHPAYSINSWFLAIELPVHLHMIVDCDYIPFYLIKGLWKKITGDSDHVYIRALDFSRGGYYSILAYCVKYLSKSIDSDDGTLSQLDRRHMTQSWGLPKAVSSPLVCEGCGAVGHHALLRDFPKSSPYWASFVDKEAVCAWLTVAGSGPPRAS
jgi:hypothetical protein